MIVHHAFMRALVLLMIALAPGFARAQEPDSSNDIARDFKSVMRLAGRGFLHQFQFAPSRNALLIGGAATGAVAFADNPLSDTYEDADFLTNDVFEFLGDEVTVGMGFLPLATYGIARYTDDPKLRAFSMETLGAMTLAYSEVVLLSQLPTHERPRYSDDEDESGFFNTALRGRYSWPSGHMVAPTVLTLKGWEYYGWKVALAPAAISAVSVASRLGGGWHYTSDMVAAVALSLSAHWATRDLVQDNAIRLSAHPLNKGLLLTAAWEF